MSSDSSAFNPDRSSLPIESAEFTGTIGETYATSEAHVSTPLHAPADAPNVIIMMLDDTGFGHTSTFGGPVQSPTADRLANEGIRYNRFHTTALCSPTRAALLTGRNHHSVHTGIIMELATGFPGYDGMIQKDTASIAETLRQNGYSTAAFGKWHNTPDYEISLAGPFDRWPTGLGFDYWWGFQGGETHQWDPPLYENITPIERPQDVENWHLSEAMTDKAISWIGAQKAAAPNKPFFLYWAPGAAHAPHHVATEWSDKYRGAFDHGWDRQRELTFDAQKKLGVIPADTELTPRPDSIPAWDSCSADEKKLYSRMQEVFAGFLEHADAQAGRLVDAVDMLGIRENTLIIYIIGDNGPSAEGSLTGTLNNMKTQQGYPDDVATMLRVIDEIGGPKHENHYPVQWCWAGSSPFQWMKQVASHFGGTRNPMIMSWPGRITDTGGLRSQFHHVIDIAPTILEVANLPAPTHVDGIQQRPIEGVSLAYTWNSATEPGRHLTQYFEMFGNRAIYHEGWVAGCRHGKLPWQTSGSAGFEDDQWELYNIEVDFSQANDLAAEQPEKLAEMKALFMAEAERYNVLPLDDRFSERADVRLRPSNIAGITRFTYLPGTVRIPEPSAPNTKNVTHTIAAEVDIPDSGAEGVLVCLGGSSAGWSFYMKDGRLHWCHNWFADEHYVVSSDDPIPAGHHILSASIVPDEEGKFGGGGTVTLHIGEEQIGSGRFERQVPFRFTVNETLDVGCDLVTPVAPAYASPYSFTGTIRQVMIDISEATFDELADEVRAKLAMAVQ